MSLYKGYVPTNGKQSMMAFKGKSSNELLTLSQALKYPSYAGVLSETTVLVDLDDAEQGEVLLNIVKSKGLRCRALRTDNGYHFLAINYF